MQGFDIFLQPPIPFTLVVHEIKDEYTAYPPNTISSYSNLAVTLLGRAVQRVSGRDYVYFVLDPKEIVVYPFRLIPAGGLSTTAVDLARLVMMAPNRGAEHRVFMALKL